MSDSLTYSDFSAIIIFMKNKKRILCLLFLIGAVPLFADIGLGAEGGYSFFCDYASWQGGVTLRISEYPFVFSAFCHTDCDDWGLGGEVDFWISNPKLLNMIHYYWGPGLVASVFKDENKNYFFAGTKVIAGLNMFPTDFLETYLQTALEFGLEFKDDVKLKNLSFSIPLQTGFRFWF